MIKTHVVLKNLYTISRKKISYIILALIII